MTTKIISRIMSVVTLMIVSIQTFAQEQVEIAGRDVGSWFAQNWMWITGGVLLLLLIVLFSRSSSSRRKTTTVVKDSYGNVKSVTTTETRE